MTTVAYPTHLAVGAHHLEPTKFLQDADWALIPVRVVRLPTPPRELLKLLAEDATVLAGQGRFKLSRIHSIEFHAKAQRRKDAKERRALKHLVAGH